MRKTPQEWQRTNDIPASIVTPPPFIAQSFRPQSRSASMITNSLKSRLLRYGSAQLHVFFQVVAPMRQADSKCAGALVGQDRIGRATNCAVITCTIHLIHHAVRARQLADL